MMCAHADTIGSLKPPCS